MVDEFSYYDRNNKLNKLDLSIGTNWKTVNIDNEILNTIFSKIDNGDGTIQESELTLLYRLLDIADKSIANTKNDRIVDNKELDKLKSRLFANINKIDIEKEKLKSIQHINMEDYSIDKIKKRFPADKYNTQIYGKTAIIRNIQNNKIICSYAYDTKTKQLFIAEYNQNGKFPALRTYDKSGNLTSYKGFGKDNDVHYCIAEELFEALKERNQQVRAQKLEKSLRNITKDNVQIVLENYKKLSNGESLIERILCSRYIGVNKRIELINQIFSPLYNFIESKGVSSSYAKQLVDHELNKQKSSFTSADPEIIEHLLTISISRKCELLEKFNEKKPNGKIDGNFGQGLVGDCWLMSTIKGLANTPKGLKILNDSLRVDNDGNVFVTLKGANKTYKITKEEIETGKSKYSNGDADVRAIEIAVEKYMKESGIINGLGSISNNFKDNLEGNSITLAFQILTGDGGCNLFEKLFNFATGFWFTDSQIDKFNDSNKVTLVASTFKSPIELPNGKLLSSHAYLVTRSDVNNVYLVNPWDTSIEFAISRNQFKSFFDQSAELQL